MAILDPWSYDKDLPDWGYMSLTRKILRQSGQERIFAWGCPEHGFQIRITRRAPKRGNFRPIETAKGVVTTSGALCLTSYKHLTHCAQIPEAELPQLDASTFSDVAFSVEPGRYEIAVYMMFAWDHEEQFAKLNRGDNYVVHLREIRGTERRAMAGWVPWAIKLKDEKN